MLHIGRIGLALFFFIYGLCIKLSKYWSTIIFFVIVIIFFSNLEMRNSTRLIINNIHLTQFNTHVTHFWDLISKSVVWPMLSHMLSHMLPMLSLCYLMWHEITNINETGHLRYFWPWTPCFLWLVYVIGNLSHL